MFAINLGNVTYLAVGALLATAAHVYRLKKETKEKEKCEEVVEFVKEVLFFTPKGQTCEQLCAAKSRCTPCGDEHCSFSNFRRVIDILMTAEHTLDICVFLITEEEIVRNILKLFHKGVFVRIITDKQMSEEASSCKVLVFRKEYVPLKVLKSSYMMHNKFAIIDNKVLLNGSCNWTRQGWTGNFENMIIVSDPQFVSKFTKHFAELWGEK